MQRHIRVICSTINKTERGPSISETIRPGLSGFGTSLIKNTASRSASRYINVDLLSESVKLTLAGKRKLNLRRTISRRIHKYSSDFKAQNSSSFLMLSICAICINYHHYQLVSLLTHGFTSTRMCQYQGSCNWSCSNV